MKPEMRRRGVWALIAALCLAVTLRAEEPYARSRDYDLQNARIHLRFDLAQRKVLGEVTHTLAPLRDGLTRLEFDSVGLVISSVTLAGKPARFESQPAKLVVLVDRPARAGEKLDVTIRYEGRPRRKGLYFILPDANYPDRRAHLWTQGESDETRSFVPIYDYPNDLTASEMIATVPAGWVTLSNGRLLSVKDEPDGTRT
jgi:aminopeptidase N